MIICLHYVQFLYKYMYGKYYLFFLSFRFRHTFKLSISYRKESIHIITIQIFSKQNILMNHEKAFKSRYFIISTGKIKCIGFDLAFGKTTKISISFLYKLYEFFYFTFRENSVYILISTS